MSGFHCRYFLLLQNGGAAYVATGRGYALNHLPFTMVYTAYARR